MAHIIYGTGMYHIIYGTYGTYVPYGIWYRKVYQFAGSFGACKGIWYRKVFQRYMVLDIWYRKVYGTGPYTGKVYGTGKYFNLQAPLET